MTRAAADRRAFLKAGVWGGSCLAFGLAAARRQAEASGRPVFTQASFNQMMQEAQASGQIKQMASEASRDLKGWLQRNFTLTPVQVQRVQGMSPQTVQQITQVLTPIAQKGGTLRLSMTEQRRADPRARTQRDELSTKIRELDKQIQTQKARQEKLKEMQDKMKELQAQLEEIKDDSSFEKIGSLFGSDGGAAERKASFALADRNLQPARGTSAVQKHLTPAQSQTTTR